MAILFVASEAFELRPLAEKLTGLRPLKWPLDYAEEGVWQGKRYVLTANGPGRTLAAHCVEVALRATSMAELSASKLESVVSTGLCGALDESLKVGDLVEGTEIVPGDGSERLACQPLEYEGQVRQGAVLSSDRVAVTALEKQTLAQTGALVVEMEAVGIAHRARAANLPFYCVKVVSDLASEDLGIDFNELRTAAGRFSRGKIVAYALSHPQAIPRLMSLRRRSQEAVSALGAFLASCKFKFRSNSVEAEVTD